MRLVPFAAGIAGGIAIAVAGYTGYWFVAAGQIEDRIEAWVEEQRARGIEVETESTEIAGFPLHFDVALSKPRVHDAKNGWSWEADRFRARVRPWDFSRLTVFPDYRNSMRVLDKGRWRDIRWLIDDGYMILNLNAAREISDIEMDLSGVAVDGLWDHGSTHIEQLSVRGFTSDGMDGSSAEALKATVLLRNVRLPEGVGEGLGENVAILDFDASLHGPLPDDTNGSIIAWRDAGGTVELRSFRVRWGPLGLESNGTLALDGDMRPIGALTANIIGYGDVIDALILSDLIPLGDAFLAKVAFNMLAEKSDDGSPPILRAIPVTAQNGNVFVGPVKIAQVPPIALQ